MNRILLRLAINAVAMYVAVGTGWIQGVQAQNTTLGAIVALGVIMGLLNAIVRPLLKILSFPLILVTLGLFLIVINTGLFWLTGLIGQAFNIGYSVSSFWAALLGGILVGLVNWSLSLFFKDELKPRRFAHRRD
ncbi:MAG: phage holin family protein [Anaerolineales bacterium]|nr:phage holin family protein [Anaerolineales bacterium]